MVRSTVVSRTMKLQDRLQELIRLNRELTAAEATEFAGRLGLFPELAR